MKGGEPVAEDIKVKPTPIQRNKYDVAVELTNLYYSAAPISSVDEIANTFLQFFATAEGAEFIYTKELLEFMPEKLAKLVKNK